MEFFVVQPNHVVVNQSSSHWDVKTGRIENPKQFWLIPVRWNGDPVSCDEGLQLGQVLFFEMVEWKLVENVSHGAQALPRLDVLLCFSKWPW